MRHVADIRLRCKMDGATGVGTLCGQRRYRRGHAVRSGQHAVGRRIQGTKSAVRHVLTQRVFEQECRAVSYSAGLHRAITSHIRGGL